MDSFYSLKFAVVCPTFNAGKLWNDWIDALSIQSVKPNLVLIIDSGSNDQTADLAKEIGYEVDEIPNAEFNHGATRNRALEKFKNDFDLYVFLTQDAILSDPNALKSIISPFKEERVGAVCGRQLPRNGAGPVEAHARLFNYPEHRRKKSKDDIADLGIKTAFMSNSFAAYRFSAFVDCGGFPADTIFAEDMSLAAKMILKNWDIVYEPEARVFHSHDYTVKEEFKRYFDVGVFYKRESWIKASFGSAGNEGLKFVKSELRFLIMKKEYLLIPGVLVRTFAKLVAFKIGSMEQLIPTSIKKNLGMNRGYWT